MTNEPSYDSRVDTYQHIAVVRGYLLEVVSDLLYRAHDHDLSKRRRSRHSTSSPQSSKTAATAVTSTRASSKAWAKRWRITTPSTGTTRNTGLTGLRT
jgi:hypothetical protein